MWKLACARRHTSPTSAYIASHLNKVAAGMQLVEAGLQAIQHPASPARPHRKSPEQGGQRGCSLWKLACARSAYQNSLSILSCIPAMHLPPPRTALAREPHATAPVPGPHDARDAARAAHAHYVASRSIEGKKLKNTLPDHLTHSPTAQNYRKNLTNKTALKKVHARAQKTKCSRFCLPAASPTAAPLSPP